MPYIYGPFWFYVAAAFANAFGLDNSYVQERDLFVGSAAFWPRMGGKLRPMATLVPTAIK